MVYDDYLDTGYLDEFNVDKKYELSFSSDDVKNSALNYKRTLSKILDEAHIKTVLKVVTGKEGNKLKKVDLYGIKYKDFLKLYFGEGTSYPRTSGKSLMAQYFLSKNEGRYKLLEVGGIKQDDYFDIEIDYFNEIIINVLLDVVTNSVGKRMGHNDFRVIGIPEFSRLYFGHGTKYGKISGKELIEKVGSLQMVLELYGIKK